MPTSGTSDALRNLSSDKLLAILEALSACSMPLRLQDLSEQVGMSQSTVLRYLNSLKNSGYVYQEEDTQRYALTWKVGQLTRNVGSALSLRAITGGFISRLAHSLNSGVCLVIEQGGECAYLDCLDTPSRMEGTLQRIGKRAPLHCTASGKVLLARKDAAALEHYIQESGLNALTAYTITDAAVLKQQLQEVREKGFAREDEECELGLRCVSMPLYDYNDQIVAALSVFGSNARMSDESVEKEILPALAEATAEISRRLGSSLM